jgi:ubiquinone/menaquinone biosynthesis C-methylase UbiE
MDFWNDRAKYLQRAGTDDLIAKQLEIEAISNYICDGMKILEVGCGNGLTALELARRYRVEILGIDFASEMIAAANEAARATEMKGSLQFEVGDVRQLTKLSAKYDLIYAERVLINLPDWSTQRQAIMDITNLLAPNTFYVMCENSEDGLQKINDLREMVGLYRITPPWHNRYLRDSELREMDIAGVTLEKVVHYSSTYYFLSRVVNAAVAANQNQEPTYDAYINQLALRLPPLGEFGQGRI